MIVLSAIALALLLIPLAAIPLLCGKLAETLWKRLTVKRRG